MNPNSSVKDIPELTASRCLAALCVVISHLHGLGFISAPVLHDILDGGRTAVSFFFILSGFVMNHNYPSLRWDDALATKRYVRSRLARLYPTVIFSLILAIPTCLYLVATHSSAQLLKYYAIKDHYSLWLALSAVAQMICVTGWLPVAAINQPWNSASWSLSCEFFFYASFPFLRPALQRVGSHTLIALMAAALALQAVWIIAIQSVLPINRSGFMIAQFPVTHLPEFCLGVATGMLIGRSTRKTLVLLISGCIATSLLLFVLIHETQADFPRFYFLLPAFAASIATIALASGSKYLSLLRAGILVRLGHASYALYMIHVPILLAFLVAGVGGRLGWLWIALLLAASYVVHFYFSEPIRRAIVGRPELRGRRRDVAG